MDMIYSAPSTLYGHYRRKRQRAAVERLRMDYTFKDAGGKR
ncbi:MAG TPA: hypothetical protein VHL11_09320 [Phototrophicaceae bacterium]|nr:hypothetical protein [Phototrophicaceae bacterium]